MMEGIKEESVGYLFNLEVQVEQQVEEVPLPADTEDVEPVQDARPEIKAKGLEAPSRQRLHYTAPSVDGDDTVIEGDFEEESAISEGDGLTRAERRRAAKGRRRK
jgi:preprotein translocase subunit SecA